MSFAMRIGLCAAIMGIALGNANNARADGLFDRLLRVMGISATPSQMRGDGDIAAGQIWIAEPDSGRRTALSTDADFRWPVYDPGSENIIALKVGSIVGIPVKTREGKVLHTIPGVEKLVGFEGEDRDNLLVVLDNAKAPLAMLSIKSGQLAPLPYDTKSRDHRRMLSHIKGQERLYGLLRVYVKSASKTTMEGELEWTDVYLQEGKAAPRNISRCDGVNCSQPSLAPNGMAVVYIKAGGTP